MDLVSVETPAARISLSRKSLEFRNALLGIVAASYPLQVVAYELIEAFAECIRSFTSTDYKLLVN